MKQHTAPTPGRCSEDKASVHGTPAPPTDLMGAKILKLSLRMNKLGASYENKIKASADISAWVHLFLLKWNL